MKFTAIINQCNLRDVHTSSPRALLRDIMLVVKNDDEQCDTQVAEFRDHCWVDVSAQLAKVIKPYQYNNNISLHISFTANTKAYKTYEAKAEQETVTKIRNITLIKAVKKHNKRTK